MTNENRRCYLCAKCDKRHNKPVMCVKHKPKNHKDTNKRTNKDAQKNLTMNRDLKIRMQAATTKEEVEAVLTQFSLS